MSKLTNAVAAVALGALHGCGVTPVETGGRFTSTSPLTLTLGTATPGGGFPVYGAALVATVQEADPGLTIDARNTKGSAENIPLLEQGKLDLALVQGEAAYEALAGINRPGPTRIRIVWAMYSSPGMFWSGGIGWPGFTAVATAPGGARFIAPSDREIDRILAKHRFLKPVTIPAGSYPGQVLDIPSVGSWSFVFAREDLPEASAYRVARALHQGEARFAARLVQARESTAANTWAAVADRSQLHPGVARYLRDAGIAR